MKGLLDRHMTESQRLRRTGGYVKSTYGTDDTLTRYAYEAVTRCKHTERPTTDLGMFGACVECIVEMLRHFEIEERVK